MLQRMSCPCLATFQIGLELLPLQHEEAAPFFVRPLLRSAL